MYVPGLRYNLVSLGAFDDAGKLVTIGGGRIIICYVDLIFRKRFGTYVGRANRIRYQEDDTTQIISCSYSHPRPQASAALMRPGDGTYQTVRINMTHSCYNHSDGYR